jgi:hypothetical protein
MFGPDYENPPARYISDWFHHASSSSYQINEFLASGRNDGRAITIFPHNRVEFKRFMSIDHQVGLRHL